MVYAGSKEAIKRALVGVGIHLNATDRSVQGWIWMDGWIQGTGAALYAVCAHM